MVCMNKSALNVAHWHLLDKQAQDRTQYGESDNTSFDFYGVIFLNCYSQGWKLKKKQNNFFSVMELLKKLQTRSL